MRLHFRPVDLARDFELCVRFRMDTHVCSFGSTDGFFEHAGPGCADYRTFLTERLQRWPDSCLHAFEGGRIVGQLEMGLDREVDDGGYVHLYYLLPEKRGLGLADALFEESRSFFRKLGCSRMRLSVHRSNTRAIRWYDRIGFVDLGPRPDVEGLRLLEYAPLRCTVTALSPDRPHSG